MSQNKTVIQGLDPNDTSMGGQRGSASNFYSRGAGGTVPIRGTVVPGMTGGEAGPESPESRTEGQTQRKVRSGKPVVGFLYSISRTPLGEYWPLHIGRNIVGQSSNCDIVLPEATITGEHAVIVVRQIKNTGGIIAAITDTQSTNGTMINGETIGFSAVECHSGDVITIGNNYDLALILMDASKLGLAVSKDFIAVENEASDFVIDEVPHFRPSSSDTGMFDPTSTVAGFPGGTGTGGYWQPDGTVGMDGSMTGNNHGGTVQM